MPITWSVAVSDTLSLYSDHGGDNDGRTSCDNDIRDIVKSNYNYVSH